MEVEIIPRFDYSQLAPASRILVEQRVIELHTQEEQFSNLTRKTVEAAWSMGQNLSDIQENTQHGQFLELIKNEFPHWSQRTTYNYINVYRSFKLATIANLDIGLKALYLLAAPSVPEETRQEAIKEAQNGNGKITYEKTKSKLPPKSKKPRQPSSAPAGPRVESQAPRTTVLEDSQVNPLADYDVNQDTENRLKPPERGRLQQIELFVEDKDWYVIRRTFNDPVWLGRFLAAAAGLSCTELDELLGL